MGGGGDGGGGRGGGGEGGGGGGGLGGGGGDGGGGEVMLPHTRISATLSARDRPTCRMVTYSPSTPPQLVAKGPTPSLRLAKVGSSTVAQRTAEALVSPK